MTGNRVSLIYNMAKINFAHGMTSYKVNCITDSKTDF